MQKALTLMNIRLEVISQVHGASGMRIIRAILEGERNAETLTGMCEDSILKNKRNRVIKSLKGHYNQSGLFALEQSVECYDFYQTQIHGCDKKIEQVLLKMSSGKELTQKKNTPRKPIRHHKPNVKKYGGSLLKIFNEKDATVLPGITDYNWMQLLSELGTDLQKWKTEKHFTSWLGLVSSQGWDLG